MGHRHRVRNRCGARGTRARGSSRASHRAAAPLASSKLRPVEEGYLQLAGSNWSARARQPRVDHRPSSSESGAVAPSMAATTAYIHAATDSHAARSRERNSPTHRAQHKDGELEGLVGPHNEHAARRKGAASRVLLIRIQHACGSTWPGSTGAPTQRGVSESSPLLEGTERSSPRQPRGSPSASKDWNATSASLPTPAPSAPHCLAMLRSGSAMMGYSILLPSLMEPSMSLTHCGVTCWRGRCSRGRSRS